MALLYLFGTSVIGNDLLAIPCKDSEYACFWLASANRSYDLWNIYCGMVHGWQDGSAYGVLGIRPVVTLKSNVKFTPAANNINDTQTWNISM